jgi:hypothetical protein
MPQADGAAMQKKLRQIFCYFSGVGSVRSMTFHIGVSRLT